MGGPIVPFAAAPSASGHSTASAIADRPLPNPETNARRSSPSTSGSRSGVCSQLRTSSSSAVAIFGVRPGGRLGGRLRSGGTRDFADGGPPAANPESEPFRCRRSGGRRARRFELGLGDRCYRGATRPPWRRVTSHPRTMARPRPRAMPEAIVPQAGESDEDETRAVPCRFREAT
jgi:hypothetical protein